MRVERIGEATLYTADVLAALRLARRAVGIELKPEYMALTRKRIAEEAAQGKLL